MKLVRFLSCISYIPVLNRHLQQVATISYNTDRECFDHCRKFYWAVLLRRIQLAGKDPGRGEEKRKYFELLKNDSS